MPSLRMDSLGQDSARRVGHKCGSLRAYKEPGHGHSSYASQGLVNDNGAP